MKNVSSRKKLGSTSGDLFTWKAKRLSLESGRSLTHIQQAKQAGRISGEAAELLSRLAGAKLATRITTVALKHHRPSK